MKLIVQPGDGVIPLLTGIEHAKKSVEIAIFRFDRIEMERALESAVDRGVSVHALIAYTNRGGEKNLRKLEARLLEAGVTIARTSDDLRRYHDKFVIIDRRILCLLAFNFTFLDIEHSRSFGIITKNRELVLEAIRLFEADVKRQSYTPRSSSFIVSPINARKELASFLKGARKELLIYDLKISDPAMFRLLVERARAGVAIRIIGRVTRKSARLEVRKLRGLRLHTRSIIRDRTLAFVGSQSLRKVELDTRREVGIVFRDSKVISQLRRIFEEDWATAEPSQQEAAKDEAKLPASKAVKEVAEAVAKDLPPVAPVVEEAVKRVVGEKKDLELDSKEIEETVKEAVKDAVKEVVKDAVKEAVENRDDES